MSNVHAHGALDEYIIRLYPYASKCMLREWIPEVGRKNVYSGKSHGVSRSSYAISECFLDYVNISILSQA